MITDSAAGLALAVVPIVAGGLAGDGLAADLRLADGAVDHFVVGAIGGAGGRSDVFLNGIAADVLAGHGDGAGRLSIAAGGGDGGGTGFQCGDGAVLNGGDRLVGGGPDNGLVGGILRRDRSGQGTGLTGLQGQGVLVQRDALGRDHGLFKPHGHIVISEVGGLGEAVAVVTGAGDVEFHLGNLAQTGQIELCPVRNDVIGAVAQVNAGVSGFIAFSIVAGSHQLYPVIRANLGRQAVAVEIAVQGIADVVDIHVVDDTRHAVGKSEGGQDLAVRIAGIVLIAEMHGEVVGAVVTAAGGGHIRAGGFAVNGKLINKGAMRRKITGDVVGDGVAAAPVAVVVPALGQGVLQLRVAGVVPGVSLALFGGTGAIGIQHIAAVLGLVDQAAPVIAACEVGAALVVGILKGQHPQLVVLCVIHGEGGDGRQGYRHHQHQQKGCNSFLHVGIFLSIL